VRRDGGRGVRRSRVPGPQARSDPQDRGARPAGLRSRHWSPSNVAYTQRRLKWAACLRRGRPYARRLKWARSGPCARRGLRRPTIPRWPRRRDHRDRQVPSRPRPMDGAGIAAGRRSSAERDRIVIGTSDAALAGPRVPAAATAAETPPPLRPHRGRSRRVRRHWKGPSRGRPGTTMTFTMELSNPPTRRSLDVDGHLRRGGGPPVRRTTSSRWTRRGRVEGGRGNGIGSPINCSTGRCSPSSPWAGRGSRRAGSSRRGHLTSASRSDDDDAGRRRRRVRGASGRRP
jgi:hypothetical protein